MEFDNDVQQLWDDIKKLKKKQNAVILAHYYQLPEIQEVADFVGDSLELSRKAAETDADVIVFCGVHFMAESAAILSPNKKVILPVASAGCPMADMVTAEALRVKKREVPNTVVVSYVNTSAEVKAESDICCTSANAVRIVQSIPTDKNILFVPDCNLGSYAAKHAEQDLAVWEGHCPIHDELTVEDLLAAKGQYPEAKVLIHPECRPAVAELADYVSSTSGLLRYAKESEATEFIVGTEEGILHQMRKQNPGKRFYLIHQKMVCKDMKYTTLPKLKEALETLTPQITVPEDIRKKALTCLERMLAVK